MLPSSHREVTASAEYRDYKLRIGSDRLPDRRVCSRAWDCAFHSGLLAPKRSGPLQQLLAKPEVALFAQEERHDPLAQQQEARRAKKAWEMATVFDQGSCLVRAEWFVDSANDHTEITSPHPGAHTLQERGIGASAALVQCDREFVKLCEFRFPHFEVRRKIQALVNSVAN